MNSSPALSLGFFIQYDGMDVAQSALQGAHYHEEGDEKGSNELMVLGVRSTTAQFPINTLLYSVSSVGLDNLFL